MPQDALLTSRTPNPKHEVTSDRLKGPGERCATAIAAACDALDAYVTAQADPMTRATCREALYRAAVALAALGRNASEPSLRQSALELARRTITTGVNEPLSTDVAQLPPEMNGWAGLLARMLVLPGWNERESASLQNVPDWMYGVYSEWLFQPPGPLAEESAWQRYGAAMTLHLRDLACWVARNRGSRAVREAVEAYLQRGASLSRAWPGPSWREYAEARGQLLTQFIASRRERFQPPIIPRAGRRLRVGFLQESFGPSIETYHTLACFEGLDPQQFEVVLFALGRTETSEEQFCERTVCIKVLPATLDDQVHQLRVAQLDVLVFAGSLGQQFNGITKLALFRLAPLQVANDRTGRTSGLPEIDLYVSGDQPSIAGKEFTERVGLIQGALFAYNFVGLDVEDNAGSRADLGLPLEVPLLATVIRSSDADAKTLSVWGDVLQQSTSARLLIIRVADVGNDDTTALCANIDAMLASRGIADERVIVMPITAGQVTDLSRVLRLVDLYLAPLAVGEPVWVALALVLGLPVVTCEIESTNAANPAAQMLRAAGATELIASDVGQYARFAVELASEPARRSVLAKQISEVTAKGATFTDTLASSDAFGTLMETAFDELSALSPNEFRAAAEPVVCFATENLEETLETGFAALEQGDAESASFEAALAVRTAPANSRARLLRGRVLLTQGNAVRATDYLLAAVERDYARDPQAWLYLAQALRSSGRVPQAVEALQTCLRMDGANVEALLTTFELAEQAGGRDLADEVKLCLRQIAPDDPRVQAIG